MVHRHWLSTNTTTPREEKSQRPPDRDMIYQETKAIFKADDRDTYTDGGKVKSQM